MKKLIKSRKGVAIELAVGVMFLMIAFTIMLLSAAGLQNSLRVQAYQSFNEMIEVNDVGEYVVKNRNDYDSVEKEQIVIGEKETDYTVSFVAGDGENNDDTYTIYKGEDVVLTIQMNGNKITSWK